MVTEVVEPSGVTKLEGVTLVGQKMLGMERANSGCSRVLENPESYMAVGDFKSTARWGSCADGEIW